jgi:hypothetical protein
MGTQRGDHRPACRARRHRAHAAVACARRRAVRPALRARPDDAPIAYRFTKDGRIILLTTFRKQRQNERHEIERAQQVAAECARRYP